MVDVAVVGAGLAGLTCAKQLQQLGYTVVVLEKSRGLGGRVATRRLEHTWADHGTRYVERQGNLTEQLINELCDRYLHPWTHQLYEFSKDGSVIPSGAVYPRFAANQGITAIAKYLGEGLEIWRSQRVTAITLHSNYHWNLALEPAGVEPLPDLTARAVVMAIPAPQALVLLEPLANQGLPEVFLAMLGSVEFEPCLSAIATYPPERQPDAVNLPWQGISFPHDANLAWIGLESSKQFNPAQPVFVVQSSAQFAEQHLETTNLRDVGYGLLQSAAKALLPWLDAPETVQVHRWRYATPRNPLQDLYLTAANPRPLVCSGDWCGGKTIESALRSGLAAAQQTNQQLDRLLISGS